MYNVKIMTVDEMRKLNDSIEYQYSTLDFIDLFIVSTNDENPYEGVIYKNGEMWVFGGRFDSQVSSLKEMLDQITSDDN